jgi:hypothetical protein
MKKKQEQQKQPMIQALVWYKEEEWDELMEMFPDRHLMPVTFKDWLVRAEELVEKIQAEGNVAIKVFIDPITFPEWCKKKGRKLDAAARTDMAIEIAAKQTFGSKV